MHVLRALHARVHLYRTEIGFVRLKRVGKTLAALVHLNGYTCEGDAAVHLMTKALYVTLSISRIINF